MVIALFGYAGSGQTTLFEILTQKKVSPVYHREETRLEVSRASVAVIDERLDALAALYPQKKKVAAHLEIEDFPGMAAGQISASIYLARLRKADSLVQVVRAFRQPAIPHPKGKVDPVDDINSMMNELILSDLIMITSRLEKLEKDLHKMKDPEAQKEKELLSRLKPLLENGEMIKKSALTPSEEKMIRGFCLLSLKPVLTAINLDEGDLTYLNCLPERFAGLNLATKLLGFCGQIEKEIMELEEEEKAIFMAGYGLTEPFPSRFFPKVKEAMNLLTFYTIGQEEVRAWLIKKNTPAIKAAGEIHTDLEKGFIRAEVISFEELIKAGSWQKAKEAGAIRLEGKDYQLQDGDIIYFRFSS
ncbi:MAG: DUF933 domain-containing protein [Acidobacteriota bacterium]|nr:DUF933 domain-containing protein [Acidobacteriota bacterium]